MSAVAAESATDLSSSAPVYSEQGRALKKRLQLRRKLEERRKREAEQNGEAVTDEPSAEQKQQTAELAATAAKAIEDAQAEEKKTPAPRERIKVGTKSLITTEMKISNGEQARLQAKCAAGKAGKIKAIHGVEQVISEFDESNLDAQAVLIFSNCSGCQFTVNSHCTKIFIERCNGCTFVFNGKIVTAVVEIDNCEECNVLINNRVGTLQVEQCRRMNVVYAQKELMTGYIVWAGCFTLRVQVGEDLMRCDFGLTAQVDQTVNVERTQFKIYYNKLGRLVCDKIIRLKNGFPTTRLEDEEFKRRQAAKLKMLADRMGITVHRSEKSVGGRVKPNAPCPCGSGKKYKKCCRA